MKTPLIGSHIGLVSNTIGTGTFYSNTTSGLTATDVQAAIDELVAGITGSYLTVVKGGGGTVQAHGNLGATETIDTANGNYHWGTLNANCVFTFTTTVDTRERWFTLELLEDGTGGWTVTWPGSVTWLGGTTPVHTTTAGTTTIYAFFTRNGGTTWIGGQLGAGATFATPAIVLGTAAAAGSAATAIRSDSTIVAFDVTVPVTQAFGDAAATGSVAFAARRDHVHGMPATPAGSNPHAHVVSEAHLSNGSATTYTLDEAFELGSVIAWNTTTLARLGVTEAAPDQATVSAAGSSGDTILFDYAATVV